MSGRDDELHIVMYAWYGLSHLTSFLRLANKLAQRGHKVSFFLPTKAQPKLDALNHHPHLITFFPITLPAVEGLSPGVETPHDVPDCDETLLLSAFDLTRDTMDSYLAQLKPNFVFFDFAYWLPDLARTYGAKSVYYITSSLVRYAFSRSMGSSNITNNSSYSNSDNNDNNNNNNNNDRGVIGVAKPPPGFPCPEMVLQPGEVRALMPYTARMGDGSGGMPMSERVSYSFQECDAIACKTCRELEGPFCDYFAKRLAKPLLLAGPMLPQTPVSRLDQWVESWLKGFSQGSVIYCALGSQCILSKDRFHQLVLGLELTGKPFLAVLKPPSGCETIESSLPEGFLERTKGRGIVYNGWVQQPLILQHPAIGCFVTHCGLGSLAEALMSQCRLVLLPQAVDQFINARFMSIYLRIGIEVEKREDDCFFIKEDVCKAIEKVMDVETEVGKEVRANHEKWRNILLKEGLEDSYINEFIEGLQQLLLK